MKKLILLVTVLLSFNSFAGITNSIQWEYRERFDAMTDNNTSYSLVMELGCYSNCGVLMVKANGNVVFTLDTGSRLNDAVIGLVRFDNKKPVDIYMYPSEGGEAVFFSDELDSNLIVAFKKYKKVSFRVTDHNGKEVTKTFLLNRATKAINKLNIKKA